MMSELKNFPTKRQWQVDRRKLIQCLLFDVHSFLEKHPEFWQTADDNWHTMNSIVAIAFSLWQSAFQTDVSGEREEIQNQIKEFIEKVLKHYAITFPDDHGMSEFTVVYYNNNARYRLERMYLRNESLAQLPSFQKIDALRREGVGDMEKLDQQDLWDDLFRALRDCFEQFKAKWEKEMRPA
jgi:hypothetical protein